MTAAAPRVLVVEDNPENLYLATILLQGEGYEVKAAINGRDAIAVARQESFAFALLDLQLPDIDGFEVARQIRERLSAAELPIIAVTAFAMAADRRKALAAGCTGYLEKPIDADSFVAEVRCLLGLPASG